MPDDDPLLAISLGYDERLDVDTIVFFLEGLYYDLHRIGDLLLIVEEHLLSDDLCHEEACRTIGQSILIKVRRRGRNKRLNATAKRLYIEVIECR